MNYRCEKCTAIHVYFAAPKGKGITMDNDMAYPGEDFVTRLTSVTGTISDPAWVQVTGKINNGRYYVGKSGISYVDGVLTVPGELVDLRLWLYFNAGVEMKVYTNGGKFVDGSGISEDYAILTGDWNDEKEYDFGDILDHFKGYIVRDGYDSLPRPSSLAWENCALFCMPPA